MGFHKKDLLDDLEECSVKLGEYLVAVFKLKANIVGLHPRYVLNKKRGVRMLVTMQWQTRRAKEERGEGDEGQTRA